MRALHHKRPPPQCSMWVRTASMTIPPRPTLRHRGAVATPRSRKHCSPRACARPTAWPDGCSARIVAQLRICPASVSRAAKWRPESAPSSSSSRRTSSSRDWCGRRTACLSSRVWSQETSSTVTGGGVRLGGAGLPGFSPLTARTLSSRILMRRDLPGLVALREWSRRSDHGLGAPSHPALKHRQPIPAWQDVTRGHRSPRPRLCPHGCGL